MSSITQTTRETLVRTIVSRCGDDAKACDAELRRIADVLNVDTIRIAWNKDLKLSAFAVLDEAKKMSRTEEDVFAAMA